MVGPWPLAPHHDHLQYIRHVHLMQRGQKRGVTFPSPFNSTVLNAYKIEQNATLVSPQCSEKLNKNGCANCMASSSSHVASLGL